MDQETYYEPVAPAVAATYHGFWPVLLMGLSLILVFVWEIQVAVVTRKSAKESKEQQVRLVDQATQVQTSLEKLVRGLVDLSATDEEAKKLVTKFGIKVNAPAVPAASPTQSP